ncbi:MAG: universal stress protein [Candidatus Obscuribacterales bacterium]|nr:universal stress protein [Candidatus Obscuribacterales bacterium]
MKVLLAVDGSRYSELAVKSVLDRTWPPDTKFDILSVVEPILQLGDPALALYEARAQDDLRDEAYILVASVANRITDKFEDVTVSTTVRDGSAATVILQIIEEWNPDLIVMGSHGRQGFKKFLLGSVSESIVKNAPCSVEIVKAGAHASVDMGPAQNREALTKSQS